MIARRETERATLREGGHRLAAILRKIASAAKPGVSTEELDRLAESLILSSGGKPAFKGYRTHRGERPFPATICTSVNDEVVHGIPRQERLLREGDILGIDIGMRWPRRGGLVTDTAVTIPVGRIGPEAERLLRATASALARAIALLRAGIRLGDLGNAIQRHIEGNSFGVVRDLVGHGVGRQLHEPPHIPNYGTPGEGTVLREGMILAIEPMATLGNPAVTLDQDGWTWRTKDGSLAAHFEHTVIVTRRGAEVLTRS